MKGTKITASLWYYCGIGLIGLSVADLIYGIALGVPLAFVIVKFGFWIFLGSWLYRIGKRQMREIKQNVMELIKSQDAFQKENCQGCKFVDENGKCLRPEPPERDNNYCYSREV